MRTPSGGWHVFYTAPRTPEGAQLRNTQSRLARGIDTRAAGGYVAAPPTQLHDGSRYTFPNEPGLHVGTPGPVVPLPAWLAEALTTPAPPPAPTAPVTLRPSSHPGTGSASDRATRYLDAAVNAETRRVRDALPGNRNKALYIAAVALGQLAAGGALTEDTVHAVLMDACAGQLAAGAYTPAEAEATIRSGLKAGNHRPRTITIREVA